MGNGGNYFSEVLRKGARTRPSKSLIGLKPVVKESLKLGYNPNHTEIPIPPKLTRSDLDSLKIRPTTSYSFNKPKNDPVTLKSPFKTDSLNILKPEVDNHISSIKNTVKFIKIQDSEPAHGGLIERKLDHDLEYRLMEYEGYDRSFLDHVSRVLGVFKEQKPTYNQLESRVRESFENIRHLIGPSHLTVILRSIYNSNKTLGYTQILESMLKMLNENELRSLHRYKGSYQELNTENTFVADTELENDVESLLRLIQKSNESQDTKFNEKLEHLGEDTRDQEEKLGWDVEYGKEHNEEKTERRTWVTILSAESLSTLTNYSGERIAEVCRMLDVNPNKLTLEEAQFILDEVPNLEEEKPEQEEKYTIIEKNGKYCVDLVKSKWVRRPIVVTVMGHVDHGKTSLLDYIHKTEVAKNEKGAITQKISTFQINSKEGKITFIDTPGHAAFMTMRKRGVSCTDLVILVVAADDGIMPQTLECIDLIKKNNLEVIVAINKVDLGSQEAVEKIEEDIRKHFKEAKVVPISARNGTNIEVLISEIERMQKEMHLKMDQNAMFKGYIYETLQDPNKGKCINIIVKQGKLEPNDYVLINDNIIKVKKIYHPNPDNQIKENKWLLKGRQENYEKEQLSAEPGEEPLITRREPKDEKEENNLIQINVNISVTNLAGNVIVGNKSLKQLQKYEDLMKKKLSQDEELKEELENQEHKIPFVGINLRCEDQGSVEAIENYIKEFNENIRKKVKINNLIERNYLPKAPEKPEGSKEEAEKEAEETLRSRYEKYLSSWVPFKIISKNLGNFNTNDLQLQQIGNIVNIGFNVQNHVNLKNLVRTHEIIYNIFLDLQKIYDFYFGDTFVKKEEAHLTVTQVGSITIKGVGKKQAVGTSVKEGQSKLSQFYSVSRKNEVIYRDLNVVSFQSNRQNVKVLNKGDNNNCLIFKEDVTLEVDDEIVAYVKQPLPPLFDSVSDHLLKV